MKWSALFLAVLLASTPLADAIRCKKVVHTCKNGVTKVYPNPENGCKFDLCPEDMDEDDIPDEVEETSAPTQAPATTAAVANQPAEWKALDANSVPEIMRDAAKLAFDLYKDKTVCEELAIEYTSVERKNASDFIGTNNKDAKYNKIATESYHIIAKLDCKLNGKDQVNGNFILNMEHHGKDKVKYFQLVECGHEEEWSKIANWLTFQNGKAYCDTPQGRKAFDTQPLHFINAASSDTTSFINVIKKDTKYIAITGALVGLLGVVLIALLVAVVNKRRKIKKEAWSKQRTPSKPVSKASPADDATIANEVNSTRGLVEEVSTKNNLAEIKI